jgi:hypothetical protein
MEKEFRITADLVDNSISNILVKDIFSPIESNY